MVGMEIYRGSSSGGRRLLIFSPAAGAFAASAALAACTNPTISGGVNWLGASGGPPRRPGRQALVRVGLRHGRPIA